MQFGYPSFPPDPLTFGVFVAVGGWVLWRTGPAPVGRLDFFEHSAATWPRTVLAPESQYVPRVPWGQLAYRLLPTHSITSYLALQLGCLALSGVLLGAWLCLRLGMRPGLIAATVIALAPVSAVLLLTIGLYDAFSVLTWILLLIALAPPHRRCARRARPPVRRRGRRADG